MKKTFIVLTLSATFLVAGCGEDKMKDDAVEFTKEAVMKNLADPESASFSDLKFVNINAEKTLPFGEYIVCGKVKGKDARGKDFETEFSSDLILEVSRFNDKKKDFMIELLPRYDFDTGVINRRYYDYEMACSKGVEAFKKNREEKSASK
jgi:hypothetical protein